MGHLCFRRYELFLKSSVLFSNLSLGKVSRLFNIPLPKLAMTFPAPNDNKFQPILFSLSHAPSKPHYHALFTISSTALSAKAIILFSTNFCFQGHHEPPELLQLPRLFAQMRERPPPPFLFCPFSIRKNPDSANLGTHPISSWDCCWSCKGRYPDTFASIRVCFSEYSLFLYTCTLL